MKPVIPQRLGRAFTLIELLVIVAVVVIIWNLFLIQVNKKSKPTGPTVECMSNLKPIAIAQFMWLQEHNGKFPWEIPVSEGGTKELVGSGIASPHFQTLSNYLNDISKFLCPTDKARTRADTIATLTDSNISYFINLNVVTNSTTGILSGDRHLQVNDQPLPPGLNTITTNSRIGWTRELHNNSKASPRGNMLFADGHVELVQGDLAERFANQDKAESRLVIP